MNDLNQFHAELPQDQYEEGFAKSDTPETFADKIAKQSYEHTIRHAMEQIEKLERERDEARREAERWRDCFNTGMSMQIKSPSKTFPWEKSSSYYCTCGNPSGHITGWESNICYDCRKPIEGLQK